MNNPTTDQMADVIFEAMVNITKTDLCGRRQVQRLEEEVERLNRFYDDNAQYPEFYDPEGQ